MDAPVRADQLEPAVLPFRQHPDDLQEFEVVHERLAFGERQAGEHILIHFGLPRVREFGRLPAVLLHEAVGYLLPRRRVEGLVPDFGERDAFDVAPRPVVGLGDEDLLNPFGREDLLQGGDGIVPLCREFGIEGLRRPFVEPYARPFLMEDDGLELVLKCEGFGAVTLVEDVAVQGFEDFNVLFAVPLHVFRPAGPCVFGHLAVIALHDAEPLAPCVEAVAAREFGRKAAGLLAELREVEVLEVGPDEPRGGQGIEQPGKEQAWVEFLDSRDVEAQAVVGNEERGRREQLEAVLNPARPK